MIDLKHLRLAAEGARAAEQGLAPASEAIAFRQACTPETISSLARVALAAKGLQRVKELDEPADQFVGIMVRQSALNDLRALIEEMGG